MTEMKHTLVLALSMLAATASAVEVVRPDEVAPGATGLCITELDGGELVEIPLTVIGTVGPWTPEGEIVLVRLDDERFQKTGIISGMSGSPVYVDDRLLGALAYGWAFSEEPIGGVTPFFRMESLAEEPQPAAGGLAGRPELAEIVEAARQHRLGEMLLDWLLPETTGGLQHLPVVVSSSGAWSPSGGDWLGESWRRLGWLSVPGGGGNKADPRPLRPGSMVAGVLVDGDAVLAAGGTVTELRGDQVWAFGHPFLGGGRYRLPMARAEVLTVLPSRMSSFKFFTVGETIGSFESDRSRGIWGRMGETAPTVPVRVTVDERSFEFRSLRHPNLTAVLVGYLVQASQAARGRIFGEQTVGINVEVAFSGRAPAIYNEVFASAEASAQAAAVAAGVVAYLEASVFDAPELEGVAVELATEERLRGAQLVDAVPARRVVQPGAVLPVRLRFRPFRGAEYTREVGIRVPDGTPEGGLDLVVADGASWSLYDLGMRPLRPGSFDDEIRLVNKLLPSTTVVLALELRQTGVTLDGGTLAVPPSVVVQLRTGLGPNLATSSYAVAARVEEAMAEPVAGAVRIELQVRSDEWPERSEDP